MVVGWMWLLRLFVSPLNACVCLEHITVHVSETLFNESSAQSWRRGTVQSSGVQPIPCRSALV